MVRIDVIDSELELDMIIETKSYALHMCVVVCYRLVEHFFLFFTPWIPNPRYFFLISARRCYEFITRLFAGGVMSSNPSI